MAPPIFYRHHARSRRTTDRVDAARLSGRIAGRHGADQLGRAYRLHAAHALARCRSNEHGGFTRITRAISRSRARRVCPGFAGRGKETLRRPERPARRSMSRSPALISVSTPQKWIRIANEKLDARTIGRF